MSQSYIPSLTPLRGLAALMVVIYHFQVLVTPVVNPERSFLINKWYIMVDFFFILSGFIITHVYQKKFSTGLQWPVFKKFMLARFARLYPLHLATLLIMLGLYFLIKVMGLMDSLPLFMQLPLDTNALLANALLLQTTGTFAEPTWNAPSWSISVEWWTYAIFPFLMLLLTKKPRLVKYGLFFLVIGAYLSIMFYFQPAQFADRETYMGLRTELLNTVDVMVGSGFLRCISGFILGVVVYLAYQKRWAFKYLSRSSGLFLTIFILMVGWSFNSIPDILAILLFGPLILMIAYNNGIGKKVLAIPGFQFLGDISYSIYMIHYPIILCYYIFRGFLKSTNNDLLVDASTSIDMTLNNPATPPTWLALAGLIVFIFITIFIAYLTYTYIERPMRDFLKSKFRKSPKQPKSIHPHSRYEVKQ